MKIEKVDFPLNIGTADTLRVIVNNGFVYYSLLDTNQKTLIIGGEPLNYKVLYSNKLEIGDEQKDYNLVENMIIDILGVKLIN